MNDWNPDLDPAARTLYGAIATAIERDIQAGRLLPGTRLPPQRSLAARLGVDLTTVTRAYAEAQRRGLLEAGVGRGTFVRAPRPAPSPLLDMTMNLPPLPQDPALRGAFAATLASLFQPGDLRALTSYRPIGGTPAEREALAGFLAPLFGPLDPRRVLLAPGAQAALAAALAMLARPDDVVLTDPLTYPGFRGVAAQQGVRLAPVAADAEGLLPEAFEQACQRLAPKALYCVPTIHNPTTATLSPERRAAIGAIAARHAVPVIEDDAYGLFPTTPLAPVMQAAGAGVYVATLAKCLAPSLRLAIVVAPSAEQAPRLAQALRAAALTPSPLSAALLGRWLEDGTAQAWRDAVRAEAAARQAIAREVLPAAQATAHPEGLHVWFRLPPAWDRTEFCAQVRRQGLALVPAEAFHVAVPDAPPVPNAVRICLGAAEDRATLRDALRAVAATAAADPQSPLGAVV
ncbi:MAG: PLP-dependent aminotransferase family protein [Rhodospirillales bacterium]|nr:PLP-dependent aminotransferase family protein [Rhodospirillales bacterium]